MLAGTARGDSGDLGSGQIRGRVLRVLLNGSGPEWSVAESGVRLSNDVILDRIDFAGCSVSVPLRLSDIRIMAGPHAAVLLRDAHIKRLGMQKRHLEGPPRCRLCPDRQWRLNRGRKYRRTDYLARGTNRR